MALPGFSRNKTDYKEEQETCVEFPESYSVSGRRSMRACSGKYGGEDAELYP